MNKINIDNSFDNLNSFKGKVIIHNKLTKLNVSGDNTLYLINPEGKLEISLLDDALLKLFLFSKDKTNSFDLIVEQNNNSKLEIFDAFESKSDIQEKIINNIIGDNNTSNIVVRVVQNSGHSEILEQINVKKKSNNNEATESLKGLVCGGAITTLPNMEISSMGIMANHFVTISSYDEQEIFYLMSKGLSRSSAQQLIKNGYLFSGMDSELREVFNIE